LPTATGPKKRDRVRRKGIVSVHNLFTKKRKKTVSGLRDLLNKKKGKGREGGERRRWARLAISFKREGTTKKKKFRFSCPFSTRGKQMAIIPC